MWHTSGVSPKSLRSCLGRSCSSTTAASTTSSRLQGSRHDISCAAWSRATVHEWSCLCRRPARSSPTSLRSDQLFVPLFRLTTVGRRTFPVSASLPCNSLPSDIQSFPSLSVFRLIRQRLKTGLSNLSAMPGRIHFILRVAGQYVISATIRAIFECEQCNCYCNVTWSMCAVVFLLKSILDFVYMFIATLRHAISMTPNIVHTNNNLLQ